MVFLTAPVITYSAATKAPVPAAPSHSTHPVKGTKKRTIVKNLRIWGGFPFIARTPAAVARATPQG
jgi:hypothetical protein